MNIIHVIDNVGAGGAQIMVRAFLNYYSQAKAIALRQLSHQPNCHNRIDIYPSKNKFSIKRIVWLKTVIKTNPNAVFHLHLINTVFHFTLIKILFGFKNQVIIHEHGEIHKADFTGSLLRWCYNILDKHSHFIAVSKDVQRELIKIGIPSQIISTINNVGFEIFSKRKDSKPFVVGFCGRIEPRKNWRFFVELASILIGNKDFKFLMAGSGPEEQELKNLIKNQNLKNIQFLGYLDNMQDFYGSINCLIIPSFWEGSSLVQQEALSSNIPVISFSGKGLSTKNKLNFVLKDNTQEVCLETLLNIQKDYLEITKNDNHNNKKSLQSYFDNIEEVYQKINPKFAG